MRKYLRVTVIFLIATVSISTQAEGLKNDPELSAITGQNIDQLAQIATFDLPDVHRYDWSDDGEKLLLSTSKGIWILDTKEMGLNLIGLNEGFGNAVAFLDHTNQIVVDNGSELILYDLTSTEITRIALDSGYVRGISDDGTLYAALDSEWDADDLMTAQSISVYEVKRNRRLIETSITLYDGFCSYACQADITFSPDNAYFAFTGAVSQVESGFVDLATGDKRPMPRTVDFGEYAGYFGAYYAQDGALIATVMGEPGYIPGAFLLIDTQTAEIVTHMEFYSSSNPDFSHSRELIAIGAYNDDAPNPDEASGFVYFFDVQRSLVSDSFDPVRTMAFERPPSAITFAPDDRLLVVSDGNGNLSLWGIVNAD